MISLILWECEGPQPGSSSVSRDDEKVVARLGQIRDLDLSEAIESDLPVARVAAAPPLTTAQYNQLRAEVDYW